MKNRQCDWLLSVHCNTTMHAVFLSPVSWEWDTNMTTFSVAFVHQLLYNAGKNSVKIKKKKQIENKKKTGKAKRIKKKTFVAVFAEYEFVRIFPLPAFNKYFSSLSKHDNQT